MRRCTNLDAESYTTSLIYYNIHMSAELLKVAIKNHETSEIFNADHGGQFTGKVFISAQIDNVINK